MIMEVTLVSTLRTDTATRLVNQGFGCVLDLRTSIGSAAGRPIEEPVLTTLRQGFVDYEQMPVELQDPNGPGLGDAVAAVFAVLKPLALVVDDVEAWRDELTVLGIKTVGLQLEAAVPLDVAA
ncbi:MAG: hypothetical protein ACPG40_10140 [Alphaproteobacteria bacterium]